MDAVGQLLEGEITGVAVLADAFAGVFADAVHGSSFLRCRFCKYCSYSIRRLPVEICAIPFSEICEGHSCVFEERIVVNLKKQSDKAKYWEITGFLKRNFLMAAL